MKHRVGITGRHGFLGTSLDRYLQRYEDEIEVIPFSRDMFSQPHDLIEFCRNCDTIVHFAAVTRGDEEAVYRVNMDLVLSLCSALEHVEHVPHVIYASSVHETRNTGYGRSKREGRMLLEEWARKNGSPFTGLVIPNVFGPFCRPFYLSFIATFCYQLTHGQEAEIHVDALMNLVYVEELMELLVSLIRTGPQESCITVPPGGVFLVSEVLEKLTGFRDLYCVQGIVPPLDEPFDRRLFTTFHSYVEPAHFPVPLDVSREGDTRVAAPGEKDREGVVISMLASGGEKDHEKVVISMLASGGEKDRGKAVVSMLASGGEKDRGRAAVSMLASGGEKDRERAAVSMLASGGEKDRGRAITSMLASGGEKDRERAAVSVLALGGEKDRGRAVVSVLAPGKRMGNHYHAETFERLSILQGNASLRMRRIDSEWVTEYDLDGDAPGYIDIPVYHTHEITNTGVSDLVTVVWSDTSDERDTFFETI
ncbi:dTDP-4-dehydrorhamnose reductase/mannose-6-phosphate isomerase-like protein (cupin superfamily) [Methanolinea mesophila]|uniref:polysaccharide biosynthesis C-terminal domain-containing protein n=1 Tax=Methanolinea mesophila TaxID=547055 RepID=UPI001AE23053|nr:NAD-dependent epimerase/dehydratase family protein [Methanolinea mesophila]MBP1928362.1 dTDP-4-dehydrorhamnose reductase/mannose-6-phosphate isomerase-like protein (cupin superfamily) [Methanolinea mesophila]